jgi:hypothetical protein
MSNGMTLARPEMSLVPREICPGVQRDDARSAGDGARSEGVMPVRPTGRGSIGGKRASFRGRDAQMSDKTELDRFEMKLVPAETCPISKRTKKSLGPT